MRISYCLLSLPLMAFACTDPVSNDTLGDPASQTVAPSGVIRGTLLYQGPRPCSSQGHIVGNALVLVFDRRVPPPPNGLANTAVNFLAITGDALFANEPRWGGNDLYCPTQHGYSETITASAPFALSPLAGASYMIEAFFDTTGHFFPTFKFADLPEQGDVGGGTIDTAAALAAINQNPNYQANFLPVDVGIPEALPAGAAPGEIPVYDIPDQGYVADNVQVSIGEVLTTTRPYFYPEGWLASTGTSNGTTTLALTRAQTSISAYSGPPTGIAGASELNPSSQVAGNFKSTVTAHYAPILTIPQDIQTFAPPLQPLANVLTNPSGAPDMFEGGGSVTDANGKTHTASGLPHLRLRWIGTDPMSSVATQDPFFMQIAPFTGTASGGGFRQWQAEWLNPNGPSGPIWQAQYIADSVYKDPVNQGLGQPVPLFWPIVILSKLEDDPTYTGDPASLTAQGDATHPVVIMQGITLWGEKGTDTADNDSLFNTGAATVLGNPQTYINTDGSPNTFYQDHITVLLRPAVICFDSLFDAANSDKRGTLVAPYVSGWTTDTPSVPYDIVPRDLLTNGDPARQQVTNLIKPPPNWTPDTPPAVQGCLPTGRYAINVVYPDGQAWTVPDEAGACTGNVGDSSGEGGTLWNQTPITCSIQPRNVIPSQGTRAVVEIVPSTNPNNCKGPTPAKTSTTNVTPIPGVPSICLPVPQQ